ncbi:MAG: flagellum-specific ATP synthase FliI, partial [Pseudomonadota bacterium]
MSDALDIPTGLYVARPNPIDIDGRVTQVSGLSVCVADRLAVLQLKARVAIETVDGDVLAEVVAVGDGSAIAVPFARPDGIRCGDNVRFLSAESAVAPCEAWLGRIVDGLGRPIDDKGPLPFGPRFRSLRGGPPVATRRARLGETVSFGVRAVDLFMPVRRGQRMGVFSGAGVGKSSLLAMIAKNMECDVAIIALVGERGREVREFVEDHLGADGL